MKKLGIVGGGQLGRMLAEAAKVLGVETVVLDPTPGCPASEVAGRHVVGDFWDHGTVLSFAKEADVLTFEIESANAEALQELVETGYPVHPTPSTLAIIKDKLRQKTFLEERDIPTAPFMEISDERGAGVAGAEFGYPFVLKARSGGYDGRGNATVASETDIQNALAKLSDQQLYAEQFVPFTKELAIIAVRDEQGEIKTYPLVETIHKNHICVEVHAPAPVSEHIAAKAHERAMRILESFHGAGVFGIEMFLAGEEVLVNEIAPRVHNSGHFTIEACATSQFENHVRAVLGMPLGETSMKVNAAVMRNILGVREGTAEPGGIEDARAILGVAVHMYDKKETRPGRKMGHVTAVAETLEEAKKNARAAHGRVSI